MNRLTIYCSELGQYHSTGELYAVQDGEPVELNLSINRVMSIEPVDPLTLIVTLSTPNSYNQPINLKNYTFERGL